MRARNILALASAWHLPANFTYPVAIVCFAPKGTEKKVSLDGKEVAEIFPDLTGKTATGGGSDLTRAKPLKSNESIAFIGVQPSGVFTVADETARKWLQLPSNPNGKKNNDVLFPYWNSADVTGRPRGVWIVDFDGMTEAEASLYEKPFEFLRDTLRPVRLNSPVKNPRDREWLVKNWWLHWRRRPELTAATRPLTRYIFSGRVSKYRLFVWAHPKILPDSAAVAIAREDDVTFGILHSRFHETWSLRLGTFLGVGNDPRYTPSTTFETFPFPKGLEPNLKPSEYSNPHAERIAKAAKNLNIRRENWLNPPELIVRKPEVIAGYPERLIPVDDTAAKELKGRTLTKLYNLNPAWLQHAHAEINAAVAAAYGWPVDISEEDALENLLVLNKKATKAS